MLGLGPSDIDHLVLGLVGCLGLIDQLRLIGDLDELPDLGHISVLGDLDDVALICFVLGVAVPGERLQLVRDTLTGDRQRVGDVLQRCPQLSRSEKGLGLHGVQVRAELGERLQGDQRERFHVLKLAKQRAPRVGHAGTIEPTGASNKVGWSQGVLPQNMHTWYPEVPFKHGFRWNSV